MSFNYDAKGAYVSAGFIDIHSDNIETVVQPRPTSVMDFKMALAEHEKQLVNHIHHSIREKHFGKKSQEAKNDLL